MKILIVEDESLLAMSYKMSLSLDNCEVIGIAATANEAFRLVVAHKPDVVLMDISLKGDIDGIEAAKTISDDYGIPIVFITGNTDKLTKDRALKVNPKGYLDKPINCEKLHRVLCLEENFDF